MPQCRSAAVLQCHRAAVLRCRGAAVPRCRGAMAYDMLLLQAWVCDVSRNYAPASLRRNCAIRSLQLLPIPVWRTDVRFRDQLRGAACSAPSLIAEGFGRWGRREFARCLTMARSELLEVQDKLLDLAARAWYPSRDVAALQDLADHALRVVTRLRSSLDGE